MNETASGSETAILVGVVHHQQDLFMVEEYLEELAFLVDTAGGIPVKKSRNWNSLIREPM